LQEAVERGQAVEAAVGCLVILAFEPSPEHAVELGQLGEDLVGDVGHEGGADVAEEALARRERIPERQPLSRPDDVARFLLLRYQQRDQGRQRRKGEVARQDHVTVLHGVGDDLLVVRAQPQFDPEVDDPYGHPAASAQRVC
jgi:hypothetical protein